MLDTDLKFNCATVSEGLNSPIGREVYDRTKSTALRPLKA